MKIKAYKAMTSTAYKVVQDLGNVLLSAVICGPDMVRYEKGKTTYPKSGANQFLFVFGTEQEAKAFITPENMTVKSYQIWEVEADDLRKEAKSFNGGHISSARLGFPAGTLFCSSLKLIKKAT